MTIDDVIKSLREHPGNWTRKSGDRASLKRTVRSHDSDKKYEVCLTFVPQEGHCSSTAVQVSAGFQIISARSIPLQDDEQKRLDDTVTHAYYWWKNRNATVTAELLASLELDDE